MPNKKLKTAFKIILSAFIMMVLAIGCNDTSSKSETKTDSTAAGNSAKMNSADTLKKDTMKMDTAKTKPIVTPN
jgi:hypothetical protein